MHHDTDLSDALAAVAQPVAQASGLPSALYTDPAALAAERRRIFYAGWICAGTGGDVPGPGDACPVDVLGVPLFLMRGRDGVLRVFQNVCRHRGMILVDRPRTIAGAIRCPYHSWCYAHDGRLRATPHVGGPGVNAHPALDAQAMGLIEVRVAQFLDAVFVDLSGTAPPFAEWIAPLARRWAPFAAATVHPGGADSRFSLTVRANWKLAVENYCESYHLPWVHPGLNAYSRLEDHYDIVGTGHSGQGTRVYAPEARDGPRFPDLAGLGPDWASRAEYAALWPNVLMGVHRDHGFTIRLEPLSHDRTAEHVGIWYADADTATGPAWAGARAQAAAAWAEVFEEDIFVVEGMQRGRGAPGFDGGRFSPTMDAATHAFHAWVADRLR